MSSLILNRPWHQRSLDKALIRDLSRKSGVPEIIIAFLYQRGLKTTGDITNHLSPSLNGLNDPWSMADMDLAVDRLLTALKRGEHVAVFGDYDADGVTSSALLHLFLKELGVETTVYIPHREKEGYGLNEQAIRDLSGSGCTLLVTVDCGISNRAEIDLARSLNMDVIVTDHHHPPESLPGAVAVLNPKRSGCAFPFKELAGVGVAFNLVRALRSRLYHAGHWADGDVPNLKAYLDLVALGTIADIVPLFEDNRILTRVGLEVMNKGERCGLDALKKTCGISGRIGSTDVAFRLAPRINAAGRMDHAMKAFRLLVTKDEREALDLARELHALNQERQNEEAKILRQAIRMTRDLGDQPAYVLASPDWQKGVVGIVASRLVDQTARPVLLLCVEGDLAQGSGRSPEGHDLYELLCACSGHLSGFGGHRAAAGLKLPVSSLDDFTRAFQEEVRRCSEGAEFIQKIHVDCRIDLEDIRDPAFVDMLELLEPFGEAYQEPVFNLNGFSVAASRIVGKNHLKLTLTSPSDSTGPSIDLLGWSMGDKQDLPWPSLELACTPFVNRFRGQKRLQLQLKDARYR